MRARPNGLKWNESASRNIGWRVVHSITNSGVEYNAAVSAVTNVLLMCRVSDEVSRFVVSGESSHGSELPSTAGGTGGCV